MFHCRAAIFCRAVLASFALMAASVPTICSADAATERAELVRLLHELENLETLVARAEASAVSTQRIRFQYLWLRGDLEKVKAGVREYLDTAPVTPRVPAPLAGDYIR
jgi:RAQPRD family integrative conjugative element protein